MAILQLMSFGWLAIDSHSYAKDQNLEHQNQVTQFELDAERAEQEQPANELLRAQQHREEAELDHSRWVFETTEAVQNNRFWQTIDSGQIPTAEGEYSEVKNALTIRSAIGRDGSSEPERIEAIDQILSESGAWHEFHEQYLLYRQDGLAGVIEVLPAEPVATTYQPQAFVAPHMPTELTEYTDATTTSEMTSRLQSPSTFAAHLFFTLNAGLFAMFLTFFTPDWKWDFPETWDDLRGRRRWTVPSKILIWQWFLVYFGIMVLVETASLLLKDVKSEFRESWRSLRRHLSSDGKEYRNIRGLLNEAIALRDKDRVTDEKVYEAERVLEEFNEGHPILLWREGRKIRLAAQKEAAKIGIEEPFDA